MNKKQMKNFENHKCIWLDISEKVYVIINEKKRKGKYKSYKNVETILKISLNRGLPIYVVTGSLKESVFTTPYPLTLSSENKNKQTQKLIKKFDKQIRDKKNDKKCKS